jgi:hypothetical protein
VVPGYWAYGDGGYFWVPGVWVRPPQIDIYGHRLIGHFQMASMYHGDIGDLMSASMEVIMDMVMVVTGLEAEDGKVGHSVIIQRW